MARARSIVLPLKGGEGGVFFGTVLGLLDPVGSIRRACDDNRREFTRVFVYC